MRGPFGPLIGVLSSFPLRLYLFCTLAQFLFRGRNRLSSMGPSEGSATRRLLPVLPSRVVSKVHLPNSRHLQSLCDHSSCLSPVWLLLLPSTPLAPHPLQPQILTSAALISSPLLNGTGLGVYEGSLWGTIWPYHRKEEMLWRAQGCVWTSRYMEIPAPPSCPGGDSAILLESVAQILNGVWKPAHSPILPVGA